jgi:hypothetical protein
MDMVDFLSKIWPVVVGFIALVIALAKMEVRITMLEEKVKSLYELWNKKNDV